jgi:ABC-type glutathione transport system ATPase component
MNEPGIIEINGLTKTYQVGNVPVHALRGVNLEIRKREFVAIIGASGSEGRPCSMCLGADAGYLRNGADQRTRSGGHERIGEGWIFVKPR